MTVEADLRTALLAVCPRVFPDFAPVSTARPYITYQQIGGDAINYIGQELPSLKHGMFQVNVWADTRAAASSTALLVEAALKAATAFQAQPASAPFSDFDSDIPVYGSRQDFSIYSPR